MLCAPKPLLTPELLVITHKRTCPIKICCGVRIGAKAFDRRYGHPSYRAVNEGPDDPCEIFAAVKLVPTQHGISLSIIKILYTHPHHEVLR